MNTLKPHLAEDAVLTKLSFPMLAFPKLDGVRGCHLTGKFTGRSLKTFKNQLLTEVFSHPALSGFDGELIVGKPTDRHCCYNTSSTVNSFTANTDGSLPDFYIFDYLTEETARMPFFMRQEKLARALPAAQEAVRGLSNLRIIQPYSDYLYNSNTLDTVIAEHLAAGYEGTILRKPNGQHKNGRATVRENNFLRIKPWTTEEAIVLGVMEAEENSNPQTINKLGLASRSGHKAGKSGKGAIGSLVCESTKTGLRFNCNKGSLSQAQCIEYFNAPQLIIGQIITFKHMPYGTKDTYRFAQFSAFRSAQDL